MFCGKAVFNPLLLGSIFVIILLSVLKISYADYKVSAAPVSYLLLPATISLAIPLYEKWDLLLMAVVTDLGSRVTYCSRVRSMATASAKAFSFMATKKALLSQGFFLVKSVLDPPAAVMLVFGVIHPGLGLFDEGFDLDAAGAAGGAAHSHGVAVGLQ